MKTFYQLLIEAISELNEDFKVKLKDNYEIADYIEQYSIGYVDREQIEEYFAGTYAELKEVDINSIKEGNKEGNVRVASKEKKYSKMTTEIPPIIVENGSIVDGNHRYRVAKQLGKEKIWIYDVKEE